MAAILQFGCTIQCPHGGTVTPVPGNMRVKVNGAFALLASDQYVVLGCPFFVGTVYHPCVLVEWQLPAMRVKINGQSVLLETSIGLCKAGDQAVQGPATVMGPQAKVKGL